MALGDPTIKITSKTNRKPRCLRNSIGEIISKQEKSKEKHSFVNRR
jgi:hypothetical protein